MKYPTTIAILDEIILTEAEDIVVDPPETGHYECIKSELIKGLADSDGKLLEGEEIGDRKPSRFYRDLKKLAILMVSDEFVLTLWKNHLQADA